MSNRRFSRAVFAILTALMISTVGCNRIDLLFDRCMSDYADSGVCKPDNTSSLDTARDAGPDAGPKDSEPKIDDGGPDANVPNADTDTVIEKDAGVKPFDGTDSESDSSPYLDTDSDANCSKNDSETESIVTAWDPPKNVILFIGDGMGSRHIDAAGLFAYGAVDSLLFESFPVQGEMTNPSADADIPDSAAAGTAIATGVKVNTGVVAMAIPGNGMELWTMLDFYKNRRKSTGLVTTAFMTDATPAAFAGHAVNRWDSASIAWHYFNTGRPEILMGGGGSGMSAADAQAQGYTVVTSLDGFDQLLSSGVVRICGLFGGGNLPYEYDGMGDAPHLYEMAVAALHTVMNDPDGFFLMIEGALIDKASHSNRLDKMLLEVLGFEKTISAVMEEIDLGDTLIIVTADHQTGGLSLDTSLGVNAPDSATWSTSGHNMGHVPLYVIGKGADTFLRILEKRDGVIDNTDLYGILTLPPLPQAP